MGKRIISQRRGRGSSTYRAPSHRYKGELRHPSVNEKGVVEEILHDPARSAPIARIRFASEEKLIIVPEGIAVGDELSYGGEPKVGNTLPLSEIPDGTLVCNIEARPGDGGRFARASGTSAILLAHDSRGVAIKLPSGKTHWFDPRCRATIGRVAGGGRTEKPLVKAGKMWYKVRSRAVKWPRVSGVAMNPVDHPFGGGRHQHTGRPKSVSRGAPPGRKVGSLAPRRTGRK